MRNIIYIFLVLLLLSCDDKLEKKLKTIADDIIANPEKLLDIKKNYKDFYSEKYANCFLTDSMYINHITKHIMNDFNKIEKEYYIIHITFFINNLDNSECTRKKLNNYKNVELSSSILS